MHSRNRKPVAARASARVEQALAEIANTGFYQQQNIVEKMKMKGRCIVHFVKKVKQVRMSSG